MGCRILVCHEQGRPETDFACLYCSTTGIAFGPVFQGSDEETADDEAQRFIDWLEGHPIPWKSRTGTRDSSDPRAYPIDKLMELYTQFRK